MLKMEEIKMKELAAALKILNDSGLIEKPLKMIGQSKIKLVSAFVAAVKAIPGGGSGKNCPEKVSDYYNLIMKDEKPETKKPVKIKKESNPRNGIGIIATIIENLQKKSLSKDEIHQILVKKFPDRPADGMKSTISIQLGPTRLGSKFKLIKDGDKYHIAA
jgi:translation initiation factor 1 (eIF-1/SUI1)